MREVSFVIGMSADECFQNAPEFLKPRLLEIRAQKRSGKRRRPSASLTGSSKTFSSAQRKQLLDKVASLVDENWSGRADMCKQFATLVTYALRKQGHTDATVVNGIATYFDKSGRELYSWEHSWVRVADDLIDGNIDSINENPDAPANIRVKSYWGDHLQLPDRRLVEQSRGDSEYDSDVHQIWWPELEVWLSQK